MGFLHNDRAVRLQLHVARGRSGTHDIRRRRDNLTAHPEAPPAHAALEAARAVFEHPGGLVLVSCMTLGLVALTPIAGGEPLITGCAAH